MVMVLVLWKVSFSVACLTIVSGDEVLLGSFSKEFYLLGSSATLGMKLQNKKPSFSRLDFCFIIDVINMPNQASLPLLSAEVFQANNPDTVRISALLSALSDRVALEDLDWVTAFQTHRVYQYKLGPINSFWKC